MERVDLLLKKGALEVLVKEDAGAVKKAVEIIQPYLKQDISPQETKLLERELTMVKGNFRVNFVKSGRRMDNFRRRCSDWLETPVRIPAILAGNQELVQAVSLVMLEPKSADPVVSNQDPGIQAPRNARRSKPYALKSRSAKYKFLNKLALRYSEEVLRKALVIKLKMANRGLEARLIDDLGKDPENAARMKTHITIGKATELKSSPVHACRTSR